MTAPPFICASCGQILAVGGGRCPTCGAQQPEAPAPVKASAMPSVRPPPAPASTGGAGRLLAMVGGLALLAFLGVVAWKLYPRFAPPPPPPHDAARALPPPPIVVPSARIDPSMGIADPGAVDAATVLVKTEAHARRWDRDARLVFVEAAPVVAGKVDTKHGGRILVVYAKPGASLLPGSRVSAERFQITVDANGPHTAEARSATGARSVAAPGCPLDRAWRAMVASGVPSSSRATMRYSMNEKLDRALWETSVDGDPKLARAIDGDNCAVVARH